MYNPLDTIPPNPPPAVAKKAAERDRLTVEAAGLGEKVLAAEAAVPRRQGRPRCPRC